MIKTCVYFNQVLHKIPVFLQLIMNIPPLNETMCHPFTEKNNNWYMCTTMSNITDVLQIRSLILSILGYLLLIEN